MEQLLYTKTQPISIQAGVGGEISREADRHKVSAVCMSLTVEPSPAVKECIQDGELQLANGQSVPIIAGGCTIDSLDGERNLNLQTGFVGDTEVRVLRDIVGNPNRKKMHIFGLPKI